MKVHYRKWQQSNPYAVSRDYGSSTTPPTDLQFASSLLATTSIIVTLFRTGQKSHLSSATKR